jgi:hypothetical protein
MSGNFATHGRLWRSWTPHFRSTGCRDELRKAGRDLGFHI